MNDWIKTKDKFPRENVKVLGIESRGLDGPEILTLQWSRLRGWHSFHFKTEAPLSIVYWKPMIETPDIWWK